MSSFCIRQSDNHSLTLAKGTSPYVVTTDARYYPDEASRYLTEALITPEITAKYAALRQAEPDAILARKAWLTQLASDLGPHVDSFLDSFHKTHPEYFL